MRADAGGGKPLSFSIIWLVKIGATAWAMAPGGLSALGGQACPAKWETTP